MYFYVYIGVSVGAYKNKRLRRDGPSISRSGTMHLTQTIKYYFHYNHTQNQILLLRDLDLLVRGNHIAISIVYMIIANHLIHLIFRSQWPWSWLIDIKAGVNLINNLLINTYK